VIISAWKNQIVPIGKSGQFFFNTDYADNLTDACEAAVTFLVVTTDNTDGGLLKLRLPANCWGYTDE